MMVRITKATLSAHLEGVEQRHGWSLHCHAYSTLRRHNKNIKARPAVPVLEPPKITRKKCSGSTGGRMKRTNLREDRSRDGDADADATGAERHSSQQVRGDRSRESGRD